MSAVNTKIIAKNTILLYVRMLLILMVSLYTSRVILQVLGVDDYGIYHLCAGFVTFLTFISNALVSTMQRYFNVALGRKDALYYNTVFSMSINVLIVLSAIILLLGETVGLWFVMTKLNIPSDRYDACIWVYQISLITFIVNVLRTPYHASIIAHEKMSFYAYFSFIEVLLRLGSVFLLKWLPGDSLILYAVLYMMVIILVNIAYLVYCKSEFPECRYRFNKDISLLKELLGFSGWNLFGQAAVVVKNQGEAIFINRFFSVAANAAMGVASQVTSALEMFVSNFQTAFTPQLIQSYAAKDYIAHMNLLFRTAKFSFFLLLIMIVPIVTNLDYILNLWLVEVPKYTAQFITYILISYLLNALGTPFTFSILATGKIKYYQISIACIFIAGLLFAYICLALGAEPYYVAIVSIIIQFVLLISRLYYAHEYVHISYRRFLLEVLLPCLIVTCLSLIMPWLLNKYSFTGFQFFCSIILGIIYMCLLVVLIGMNRFERNYIIDIIKQKVR